MTTNKNSVMQRLTRLEVDRSAVFPIDRADYIRSVSYKVAQRHKRKHTTSTTGNTIKVTRIE